MITIPKLREYEEFRGYYDGYYIQKAKDGKGLTTDDEWYLIRDIIQNIRLVNKGLASKEFGENVEKELIDYCDNGETIKQIKMIAEKAVV